MYVVFVWMVIRNCLCILMQQDESCKNNFSVCQVSFGVCFRSRVTVLCYFFGA
jgi:hypothetical protein